MTSNRKAVREAYELYRRRDAFTEMDRGNAVMLLAGQGIWSKAQIANITGATSTYVKKNVEKTDHTGGRFNPDTFDLILELVDINQAGERNPRLVAAIVDAGTSVRMLSRLSGRTESSLKFEIKVKEEGK